MKDNVLFINRDKTEINEFRNAMRDYTFEVDTADSGLEAAAMLRKKSYKVVITGMNLSTYDGMKLITYLNGHCPYTACIVYTTRIDLAQLRLLVNKRDVFRIFLKPVNYRGDFYNAIQDGFVYYDMREIEEKEQKSREKKQKSMEDVVDIKESALTGGKEWSQMKQYVYPFLQWSMQSFEYRLPDEEERALEQYEQSILEYYLREDYEVCRGLKEVKAKICQEFIQDEQKQKITLEVNQRPVNPKPGFYAQMHFIMWLLIRQIADISLDYEIKIKLDFQIPFRPEIQIQGKVKKEELGIYQEEDLFKARMEMISHIVRAITGQYQKELTKDAVSYHVAMRTEEHKRTK